MSDELLYETPRVVTELSECFFYHVMDLPDVGVVGLQFDLRPTIDAYLGNLDFEDQRVLDVGAASGFLTFEMEKRGASVVSFDLGNEMSWDIVPYQANVFDYADNVNKKSLQVEKLINAYWYAHRALGSSAKVYYGDVYHLPDALGQFDIVVMGAILLHLRDPFKALLSASRLSRKAVVVTDLFYRSSENIMQFVPDPDACLPTDTWWQISEGCMIRMLKVVGFETIAVSRSMHKAIHDDNPRDLEFSTYVGYRPS